MAYIKREVYHNGDTPTHSIPQDESLVKQHRAGLSQRVEGCWAGDIPYLTDTGQLLAGQHVHHTARSEDGP
jgi:hypothetical protein